MINWTIKPLFNHLLIPLLKTIVEIIDGLIGGLFGEKSDESKKVELKKTPIEPRTPVDTENEEEIDNDKELAKDLEIVKLSNDMTETVTPS